MGRDVSWTNTDIDRDINLVTNVIDRDVTLGKNVNDRDGQLQLDPTLSDNIILILREHLCR